MSHSKKASQGWLLCCETTCTVQLPNLTHALNSGKLMPFLKHQHPSILILVIVSPLLMGLVALVVLALIIEVLLNGVILVGGLTCIVPLRNSLLARRIDCGRCRRRWWRCRGNRSRNRLHSGRSRCRLCRHHRHCRERRNRRGHRGWNRRFSDGDGGCSDDLCRHESDARFAADGFVQSLQRPEGRQACIRELSLVAVKLRGPHQSGTIDHWRSKWHSTLGRGLGHERDLLQVSSRPARAQLRADTDKGLEADAGAVQPLRQHVPMQGDVPKEPQQQGSSRVFPRHVPGRQLRQKPFPQQLNASPQRVGQLRVQSELTAE
mmetsp:Transcript_56531/g.183755  ORF Transcript_56531/g.183755 Transcript_56531/m.183755 type:complete len:320 (+) Transcript_56531:65-1024(+)